jgi:hypothetical protein
MSQIDFGQLNTLQHQQPQAPLYTDSMEHPQSGMYIDGIKQTGSREMNDYSVAVSHCLFRDNL